MQKEVLISYFPKITHKRYTSLLKHFGTIDSAFLAEFSDFGQKVWEENIIQEFILWKKQVDEEALEKELQKENIQTISYGHPDYPLLLKEIYDPPLCLFVRGNIQNIQYPFAIVGTRKASRYGKQITEEIVKALTEAQMTIISGLALGIDGVAHETNLKNKGKTIAVLGCGIDRATIYPRAHQTLSEKIIEQGGAILSEYPPKTLGTKYSFPKRNRIIAGMSLGVLVVEAQASSGALITAQAALEYNREVFAIPHNITSSTGQGPNNLLKLGARVVTQSQDILDIFGLQTKQSSREDKIIGDNPEETLILQTLSREPIHIDVLIKQANIPSQVLLSHLTLLEIKGKVRNLGNMNYILIV